MKRHISLILIITMLIAGTAILLYPTVSNWIAVNFRELDIVYYNEKVEQMDPEYAAAEMEIAKAYNDALTGVNIKDPFIPGSGITLPDGYASVLNVDGIIGYITIPKIDVHLPIRHGIGAEVLKKGVGHMENTAFPIGGEGNHAVLTGHTGLTSAKLFTDLDQLMNGDMFYIHVLNEKLAYEVEQILVIKPEDTENLRPVKGKDYVTLITCTPYGINSHRLLLRGTRVPYTDVEKEQAKKAAEKPVNWRIVMVVSLITLSGFMFGICKLVSRRTKRGGR